MGSLNIPRIEPSQSYKKYVDHPQVETLNQIMVNYLGMEEILKLYSLNQKSFETSQSLNILSQRFNLPKANNFKDLLKSYDIKYATVRSYHRKKGYQKNILFNAAKEGNIQALYNGLKMYPELRKKKILNETLKYAAINANRLIIDLLLELGADHEDRYGHIILGASIGGHIDIIKEYCVKKKMPGNKGIYFGHNRAAEAAAKHGHLNILDYLLKKRNYSSKVVNFAFFSAGRGGNQTIIDYLISKGADDYFGLLKGAASTGHLGVVKKYFRKALKSCKEEENDFDDVFIHAVTYNHLKVAKFIIEKKAVTEDGLREGLKIATAEEHQDIINYLTELGVTMPSEEEDCTESDNETYSED